MSKQEETVEQNHYDDPYVKKYHPLMIFLVSMIAFGSCFAYDIPQALQTQLQSPPLNLSFFQFNGLYSVYSAPNVFIPFIGGLIVSLIGINTAVLVFTFLSFIGHLFVTLGIVNNDYTLIVAGRIIYALGSEVLSISEAIIAVKWFSSKDLTMVLGWNNSIGSLGSNLNVAFSPLLYSLTNQLWVPCAVGVFFCFASFLSAVGYVILDRVLHTKLQNEEKADVPDEQKVNCTEFKGGVNRLFLVLCAYYAIFYLSFDGVTTTMNDQIHQRFGFTNAAAGNLMLIYYVQLTVVPPIIGKIVDKSGNYVFWLILAAFACMNAQLLLGVLPDTESRDYFVIIPLLILGFSDSVFKTVTWSYLLLSVHPNIAAIGYGFAVSSMNLLNVFGMIGIGKIQDLTRERKFGYYDSQLCLAGIAGMAMLIAIIVLIIEWQKKSNPSEAVPRKELVDSSISESTDLLQDVDSGL